MWRTIWEADAHLLCRIYHLCLPELTHAEREVLEPVLNSWLATPETVQYLWLEVNELSDDEYPGVDIPELIAHLRNLSRFECWAIYNGYDKSF